MLKAEERMEVAVLKKHGDSIRAIARAMGVSRNTVRRYLRGGEKAEVRKPAPKRAEKLDAFKGYIVDRLKRRRRISFRHRFCSARSSRAVTQAGRRG